MAEVVAVSAEIVSSAGTFSDGVDGKTCRIFACTAKALVLAADLANLVLDGIFVSNLASNGEPGMAALMGTAMSIGFVFFWVAKCCRLGLTIQGYEPHDAYEPDPFPTDLIYFCASEIMVYLMEDTTTLFIYTRVEGAYDPGSLADVLNVVTTTISSACVLLISIYSAFRVINAYRGGLLDYWKAKEDTGVAMAICLFPVVPTLFFFYVGIGVFFVEKGVILSQGLNAAILAFYIVSWVCVFVMVVLVCCMSTNVLDRLDVGG